jgi:hypothetical protein
VPETPPCTLVVLVAPETPPVVGCLVVVIRSDSTARSFRRVLRSIHFDCFHLGDSSIVGVAVVVFAPVDSDRVPLVVIVVHAGESSAHSCLSSMLRPSATSETGHRQSGVKIISGWTNTIRHENPKSFGSCKVRQ